MIKKTSVIAAKAATRLLVTVAFLVICGSAVAEQSEAQKPEPKKPQTGSTILTLQSTITGNREQPKVLYIVPWQAPDGPESLRQGFQSDLDELFQPVERAEFLRQLKHRSVPLSSTTPQNQK
ncbi:hypothetical protein KFE80_04120 [bacterium SCSIO 12696]|nr:hypothetical protein KFE80_04120 [bacterium SCSIO 12696]